jgi:hypothetical protein
MFQIRNQILEDDRGFVRRAIGLIGAAIVSTYSKLP